MLLPRNSLLQTGTTDGNFQTTGVHSNGRTPNRPWKITHCTSSSTLQHKQIQLAVLHILTWFFAFKVAIYVMQTFQCQNFIHQIWQPILIYYDTVTKNRPSLLGPILVPLVDWKEGHLVCKKIPFQYFQMTSFLLWVLGLTMAVITERVVKQNDTSKVTRNFLSFTTN